MDMAEVDRSRDFARSLTNLHAMVSEEDGGASIARLLEARGPPRTSTSPTCSPYKLTCIYTPTHPHTHAHTHIHTSANGTSPFLHLAAYSYSPRAPICFRSVGPDLVLDHRPLLSSRNRGSHQPPCSVSAQRPDRHAGDAKTVQPHEEAARPRLLHRRSVHSQKRPLDEHEVMRRPLIMVSLIFGLSPPLGTGLLSGLNSPTSVLGYRKLCRVLSTHIGIHSRPCINMFQICTFVEMLPSCSDPGVLERS